MKTSIAIVVVGGCLLGGVWATAADGPRLDKLPDLEMQESQRQAVRLEKQLEAMKELIETLKAETERMAERLATLEKDRMVVPPVPSRPDMPIIRPPHDGLMPKGWVPREFNGRTYYVIPIGQDPNKAMPNR